MEHFSTRTVAPALRRGYWRDVVADTFPGMTVAADEGIRADLVRGSLGAVGLASARSQRARVARVAGATDRRHIVLHLQRRGRMALTQGAREAFATVGSIAVADDAHPYDIDISDGNDCLIVHVPTDVLNVDAATHDWRARLLDGADRNVALLGRMIVAVWEEGERGALDPACATALLAMIEVAAARAPCNAAVPAAAPVAFALQHLRDPALSTEAIAVATGLSTRGVQKAFLREAGVTPSAFILDRRLAHAAELLRGRADQSVTDVAYAVGFGDSSQFARAFRRRYATSPSRWRRAP